MELKMENYSQWLIKLKQVKIIKTQRGRELGFKN